MCVCVVCVCIQTGGGSSWLSGAVLTPGAKHSQTVETIVHFRRNPPIMNSTVAAVESFRFLGSTISQDLKWDTHIESMVKKAQQSLFPFRPRSWGSATYHRSCWNSSTLPSSRLSLCSSITVWFGSATKRAIRRLQRTVRTAERIIGAPLPSFTPPERGKGQRKSLWTLTPSSLSLWTVALWPALQITEHQNSQTQEQFLKPQAISHLNNTTQPSTVHL